MEDGTTARGPLLSLTLVAALLAPAIARASGDAHSASASAGSGLSLTLVVGLVLGIAVAYLLAHFVVDRLQQYLLFSTGVEYLLLGGLLSITGVVPIAELTPLAPVIALAVGFFGLLFGLQIDIRKILELEDNSFRLALLEGLGTGAAVTAAGYGFFVSGLAGEISMGDAWLASAAMGCAAWAGSSNAVDLVASRFGARGPVLDSLRRATLFSDMLAIVAFGLLFCVFHRSFDTFEGYDPGMVEWGVITIGLGLTLGILFTVFLDKHDTHDPGLLALTGIITFAAGAAFFLDLSVLLVNALLGMVLAHTADGQTASKALSGTRKPMTLMLLVFAGALWKPVDPLPAVIIVAAYPVVRAVGKVVGAWLASIGTPLRADMFRGLLAQGTVAVAMAISVRLVFEGVAIDLAYTAILSSVLTHELFAPRVVKGLLVDAGEIRAAAS